MMEATMSLAVRAAGAAALALAVLGAAPVAAQGPGGAAARAVHEIRFEHGSGRDEYRLVPASVTARPGEVLRFRVASGAPHGLVIEGDGLAAPVQAAWNAALPRRAGNLTGPLLLASGDRYEVVVPAVPAGRYRIYCLPHRAYHENGVVIVQERRGE